MAERIATIKLNSGQGGFYDELTNIHLTVSKPIAHLYAGQNLTNIRKGISVGHLLLMDGTLGPDPRPYRLVRVGNRLEINLKPGLVKAKAKPVEVKLKDEEKAEPKKVADVAEKAAAAPDAKEIPAEEAPKEEKTEAKTAPKKAAAKKATKKAAKQADAE